MYHHLSTVEVINRIAAMKANRSSRSIPVIGSSESARDVAQAVMMQLRAGRGDGCWYLR